MTEGFARVARSLRGRWVENVHFGVAALATPRGELVARLGDPSVRVFLRSAAKPIQLLPLMTAGGQERFGLSQAEIALMCSSHAGTESHIAAIEALLARIDGLTQDSLVCASHPPLDSAAAAALAGRGESPGPLHNNCSANHLGQLLACLCLGYSTRGYNRPDHPLQKQVAGLIAEFTGVEAEEIQTGVDGCGLPSFCVQAAAAAHLYARLALPENGSLEPETVRGVQSIVRALAEHPEMVAGPGRFATELNRVTGGRLIGKEGAEGFFGVAVRGPVALGAAVKIIDGTEHCRDGVVLEILRQAGCLSGAEFKKLSSFYRKELENHAGEVTGELAPDLELIEAGGGYSKDELSTGPPVAETKF